MIAVGLGSVENARRFSEVLQFPLDVLYAGTQTPDSLLNPHLCWDSCRLKGCQIPKANKAVTADETGQCYKALGFSPGFAPDANVSPYLKLLPMLAGIGSPGTIQEVKWRAPPALSMCSGPASHTQLLLARGCYARAEKDCFKVPGPLNGEGTNATPC